MAIVKNESVCYSIISGQHKGKGCSVCPDQGDPTGRVTALFSHSNETALVEKGALVPFDKPGWRDAFVYRKKSYDIESHVEHHKGTGSNLIYTKYVAQPRALQSGDVLATGEIVLDVPRRGFNSSALIKLSVSGWIELAARLPVALLANKKHKFPIELVQGEKLITRCLIARDSISGEVGWARIFLDNIDRGMLVPACIPLALL